MNKVIFNKYQYITTVLLVILTALLPLEGRAARANTQIKLFMPFFEGELSRQLAAKDTFKGNCIGHSIASSGRPDAWRCQSENNELYDPCFSDFSKSKFVCAKAPWDKKLISLTMGKAVNADRKKKIFDLNAVPWALSLKNGQRCVLLTGATGSFSGMRANYACSKNGYVLGDIDRSGKRWHVFYYAHDALYIRQIAVATAWY